MKKTVIVSIIGAIGLFAILFWTAFAIIAYRNEYYVFDVEIGKSNNSFKFYENNGINYYSYNGFKDAFVFEKRFIFKLNKRNIKEVIKEDELDTITSKMHNYKYDYGGVIETKYRDKLEDETFCITKCDFFVDEKTVYIFSDKGYLNICRWFK